MEAPRNLTVIYDIANEGFLSGSGFVIYWTLLVFSVLIFFIVRICLYGFQNMEVKEKLAGILVVVFVIVGVLSTRESIKQNSECRDARANGNYSVVEGVATILDSTRKSYTFQLGGKSIKHSSDAGCGYRYYSVPGISDGRYARVYLYDGRSLRVEIESKH